MDENTDLKYRFKIKLLYISVSDSGNYDIGSLSENMVVLFNKRLCKVIGLHL